MVKWTFEVRNGNLATLPSRLSSLSKDQTKLNASCYLVAEAGSLLNEPDEQIVQSICAKATPGEVIAGVSKSLAWLFDHLELEVNQDFRHNYLKVSFVNLQPIRSNEIAESGQMTTNSPELPEAAQTSPEIQFRQMVGAFRALFSHLRAAVEIADWTTESFACDWVALTFNKVG